MIDPFKPQNFDATVAELEEILLFCIVVAGKTATTQAKLLENFLYSKLDRSHNPFKILRHYYAHGITDRELRKSRLGQYTRLRTCFNKLAFSEIDLETCTIENLESITGIGPKTARFFMLCTRPNVAVAALDTHILKFLADQGHKVPRATPPRGEQYNHLEKLFLAYATINGKTAQEFDLEIWKKYRQQALDKTD